MEEFDRITTEIVLLPVIFLLYVLNKALGLGLDSYVQHKKNGGPNPSLADTFIYLFSNAKNI